ncbi:MAG: murein biosynthesis integral membrane protein MurJ [Candidatus Pacebacteria bacterium]|nr:murein biosynthesis integral membrane protein MurJ [Candidatus Paceibacterota bacterium]
MVSKIFNFFKKESNRITEAAFLIGGFALLSQILGLVRDRSLASVLGPSATLDIYYAGFRVPDIIFASISTLVSITVLIPFFIDKLEHKDKESARSLLNQLFTIFSAGIAIISVLAFILMPFLSHLVAPGFGEAERASLVTMSRIMLLSPIFLGLSNLFSTITQLYKRFIIYAFAPICYNLGIIIGIFFFLPRFGNVGLAMGVALGAFLHMALQLPVLASHGFYPRLTTKIDWKEMRRVFLLSLPRTLGLALSSITIAIIVSIATTLETGAVSIFNFSFNLQAVPITIIGLSYSVAAFPSLSKAFAEGKLDVFKTQIISVARQIIFWSLPVMALFIILRAQIVRVILGSGQFTWSDTRLTAAALALFTISVVAQSLIGLLVRGYYAAGKTRRPLVINLIFTALEVFLALGFLYFFRHYDVFRYFIEGLLRVPDVPGTEMLMLPLGYSVGTILNYYALWMLFKKDFLPNGEGKPLRNTLFQGFCAAVLMGTMSYGMLSISGNYFEIDTTFELLAQGVFAGAVGIITGGIILSMLGSHELKVVLAALRKKIWKTETIVSEGADVTQ